MVQSLFEAAVCKLFPTTLKGPATIWYQCLKEGSIQSFDELARAFRTHFTQSIKRKKKSSDLKLCYQKPGESLRSYIGRFNAEAVEVGNLNDDTCKLTLGSWTEPGITSIWMKEQRMKATQTTTQFETQRPNFSQTVRQDRFRPRDQRQPVPPRMELHRPVKVEDQAFIPLNTPRSHILMWIQINNELVRYPPKLQYEGDGKKYCQFYDGHGHVTNECGSIKKEIDRLVQVGRLKDFVA
ncbi:uncharacterized protein LOC126672447 [Mercurialis annua]|uniref:uncharacterized protein LOC126672447 n=1 Tax=Mercurialis annua TaxID=3986 RepID=UPI00215DECCC|nr:uncharacterized protein LOC126672447 [Mercurialis annua]